MELQRVLPDLLERARGHESRFPVKTVRVPWTPGGLAVVMVDLEGMCQGGSAWFRPAEGGFSLEFSANSPARGPGSSEGPAVEGSVAIPLRERVYVDDTRIGSVALAVHLFRTMTTAEVGDVVESATDRRAYGLSDLVEAMRTCLVGDRFDSARGRGETPGVVFRNSSGHLVRSELPMTRTAMSMHRKLMRKLISHPDVMDAESMMRVRAEFSKLVRRVGFEAVERVWEEELVRDVQEG